MYFEKFIRNHIFDFIREYVYNSQPRSVSDKSTLCNIFENIDVINEDLMKGDNGDILYLNFSKTFDTISHHRLLYIKENSKYCKILFD